MPSVLSYTPPWLSRPSPGFDFFSKPAQGNNPKHEAQVPLRTIACSGSEVFIEVNNEVRWADLVDLKERWEEGEGPATRGFFNAEAGNESLNARKPFTVRLQVFLVQRSLLTVT